MSQIDHRGYIWKGFGMTERASARGSFAFVLFTFFRMRIDLCFVELKVKKKKAKTLNKSHYVSPWEKIQSFNLPQGPLKSASPCLSSHISGPWPLAHCAPATWASFSLSNGPGFFPPQDLHMCCFFHLGGLPLSPLWFPAPYPPAICLAESWSFWMSSLTFPSGLLTSLWPHCLALTCILSSVFPSWPFTDVQAPTSKHGTIVGFQ